ncbi:hypothetical protein G3T20_05810 [Bordetella hinzii]|uniref:hypothetical protein n=1 Tax=Bordetella hinzii TaxID=103855 RepID=UPI0013EFFE64|nr:hypothetical protein [Bordetella hinzii]QII84260.1 hypothetical protein G3T20_05810 [Bordetella hinzii]
MASEVDICNLALSHLGDEATVASIDPPEGSPQAGYCARFYPAARDALLEMHAWGFAMRRVQLALLPSHWSAWQFAYARPSDTLKLLAVLPPDAPDDYDLAPLGALGGLSSLRGPQPYSAEVDAGGRSVIYTDQPDAVLRYTALVRDTTKFSPLFVMALSWHLASLLAGPMLKGDVGAAEGKRCAAMMQQYLSQAITSDTNQRRVAPSAAAPWIAGR